ncbi:hypothetical protein IGI04_014160 [Brassica rapa subsp. trilocularis]|uniref:Uncharacterized protein n=1 Tax=Brassica rapa subsp. trilocularis TaxID=1813537 RepID=A0ABQ7MMY7_BRACM|nr:hypothetical protein IGI04_014160 [Brassica rapa subsp. trilocularis]
MAATEMIFHHMVLIFHSFKGFSDVEDFWARRLPGSFPNDFQEVLIRRFSSSTWICFTDLSLIYMFFRSGSDYGRPMESILGSLLKYNALQDFQKVFQTTSKKSSRRVP